MNELIKILILTSGVYWSVSIIFIFTALIFDARALIKIKDLFMDWFIVESALILLYFIWR